MEKVGQMRGLLGLSVALGLCLGVWIFVVKNMGPNTDAKENEDSSKPPSPHFVGWTKPDLAIVITGQTHGYIQPCGCSSPQYGGLTRRYNFIQSLRAKGWPVAALDVGEMAQSHGPQAMIKYVYSMKAMDAMGYSAVGLGLTEFNMPLTDALAHYSVEKPTPTPIASNLLKTSPGQDFYDLNVRQFKVIDSVSPRLGIISAVDPKFQAQVRDTDCKFEPAAPALAKVLKDVRKAKAQVNVLLYQGTDANDEAVKFINDLNLIRQKDQDVPGVQIMVCLSPDPEPPGRPKAVNGTQIVSVGHKGRYVGVIGLFMNKNRAYELKYELVAIGEEFDTPAGQEGANPVMALMEEYTRTINNQGYLGKFPRGPHSIEVQLKSRDINTKFVGSEKCANCHEYAYKVWQNTGHAHAFDTLVKARNPSGRNFDGECVVCHTVGFQYNTGYLDRNNDAKQNSRLVDVGCENCHGPCAAHVNKPHDATIYPLINPQSTKRIPPSMAARPNLVQAFKDRQMLQLDSFCQKCHDLENDVHWGQVAFAKKWARIDHNTPVNAAQNQPKVGGIKIDVEK